MKLNSEIKFNIKNSQSLLLSIIIPTIIIIGGIALLGLPGVPLLSIGVAISYFPMKLLGHDPGLLVSTEAGWPAAILMTLLWPPSIFIGYLISYRFLHIEKRETKNWIFVGILVAWAVALTVWMTLQAKDW